EIFRYYRMVPRPLRRMIHGAALKVPSKFERVSFDYKLKKFTEAETTSILEAHSSWRTIFSKQGLREILSHDLNGHTPSFTRIYDEAFVDFPRFPNEITGLLYADLKAWLIPMLPWTDNISMAHSIELRLPFLDYRLVDRALSLPQEYLFKGWELKRLMKKFLHGRLPDDVLYRPKRGTHLPLSKWLNTELKELKNHYLSDTVLNKEGLFNMEPVRRYAGEHERMEVDHTFKLWNLIMFSAWKEQNGLTL
ncbi:MAG: asparagine synthase C-terminal domain-containing protein, partial [Deltaproteobacteria bacterium]|nr:asparagine synthase C-terminal domain-containing protein [Deltaproteobacteria bacterium]